MLAHQTEERAEEEAEEEDDDDEEEDGVDSLVSLLVHGTAYLFSAVTRHNTS